MKLEKTFDFDKIDYNHIGRKINKVTIDVQLRESNGKLMFTAIGSIWNSKSTDAIHCGQCLDTITKFVKDPLFKKLYRWWQKYHLKTDIPENELNEMKSLLMVATASTF